MATPAAPVVAFTTRGNTAKDQTPGHAPARTTAGADRRAVWQPGAEHLNTASEQRQQNHDLQSLVSIHAEQQQQEQQQGQQQQQQQGRVKERPCKAARSARGKATNSRVAPTARSANAERLAAASALLKLPCHELRRYRGFCSELRALELTPTALNALCGVLVQAFGLAPAQLCAVLLRQPHVLRVPPSVAARRGAALALELQLPPPPGPGGGGPLAAIIAAVPDVLLRRSNYAGTTAALAAALALPPADAQELLRQEPQLLRHPPGFFARTVVQLREQLGLPAPEAAALAAAEPQLLAVSPGVLRANGSMLRSLLQLSPEQLAEMVGRTPELLVRSPGALRAVVQRLTSVLSRSSPWRVALPRLLASPRNLAVALSFGSNRYDRLEYLAATGRDRIMGFKDGLSLAEEDFLEVFPEYQYNVWRQTVPRTDSQPPSQARQSLHPHRHPHPQPCVRTGSGSTRAYVHGR